MLYLVRHAKAQPRILGIDHPERPLTSKGQHQALHLAAWFRTQTKPSLIFSSPFRRCVETALPIATALQIPFQTVPWLAHGVPVELCIDMLQQQGHDHSVVLVGHEPELTLLLQQLVEDADCARSFSKAGIACLEPAATGWRLLWQYRYKQLLAT